MDSLKKTTDAVMESGNGVILDAIMKCRSVLETHEKALISVSGGGDSDCMLDLVERTRVGLPVEVTYLFIDTGLEYAATKRHLDYLEDRYGVAIRRERPEKSIPTCAREFGQPFSNKFQSDMISRLQRNGFQWEDEPLEVLLERYPNCVGPVKWWCNAYGRGMRSSLDIGFKRGLKEFMVENPPTFKISSKCCHYAKKQVVARVLREGFDLDAKGVRKFEGGLRSRTGTCFTPGKVDAYRPIYWFNDDTKAEYERLFGIVHSDCYTVWGFTRTGCVGCPYNKDWERDLAVVEEHEPGLARAARAVFADAYDYTRQFNEHRKKENGQMPLF